MTLSNDSERDVDEAMGEFLDLADDMFRLEDEGGYVLADYINEDRAKRLRTLGIKLAAMGETWLWETPSDALPGTQP